MTTIDPRFGQEMKRLRTIKGISQRKLGEIVGLGSGYISRIERGEFKPPSEEKIVAIADALGGSREYMLALSGKIPSDVSDIVENQPEQMSKAVRSLDSVGDWSPIAILILLAIVYFIMKNDNKQAESKKEWTKLLNDLRKEAEKLPAKEQLGVIGHIRDLMDSWENDVTG